MTPESGSTNPDSGGQSGAPPPEATPDPSGEGSPGQTFTQEQVARLLADEKRKTASRFSDYDTIKSKLAEMEAAGQSELERAQTQAKDADARATEAIKQRNRLLVQSAVTSAAARAGALDPDVVVALLAEGISVDAEGNITGDVNELVTKLLEDKPFLRNGTSGHGSADQGAHTRSAPTTDTPNQRMDNLFRSGR